MYYDGEPTEVQKWGFGGLISISMMVVPSRRHQIYRLLDPALRSSDFLSRKYYSPRPALGHMIACFLTLKLEPANAAPLEADHAPKKNGLICKIDLTKKCGGGSLGGRTQDEKAPMPFCLFGISA